MEILLNTTWLMVAAAAFVFWQVELKGAADHRQQSHRFRVLTLTVVLILLFPVISLTDDLHAEQAAMEDSSRTGIKARNLQHASSRSGSAPFVPVVTHRTDSAAALRPIVGAVLLIEPSLRCFSPVSAHDGRSPPFTT
jgi:hypothetical protein